MNNLTRDQWIVYACIRTEVGKNTANEYKRNCKIKNAKYGINIEKKNPWNLAFSDYDSMTYKRFFPGNMSEEDKKELVEEISIDCINSQYDCTGCVFTTAIDFYNVPGGVWVYHCMALDV